MKLERNSEEHGCLVFGATVGREPTWRISLFLRAGIRRQLLASWGKMKGDGYRCAVSGVSEEGDAVEEDEDSKLSQIELDKIAVRSIGFLYSSYPSTPARDAVLTYVLCP